MLIALIALGHNAFANSVNTQSDQSLASIVDDFNALKTLKLVGEKHNCNPQGQSCFRTACSTVGIFECDDLDEMNLLRRACRGVWGDSCIKISFNFLHRFEYDDNDEMVTLVNSCRGVYDTNCISYSCQRIGRFGCDDIEEITAINQACAGN